MGKNLIFLILALSASTCTLAANTIDFIEVVFDDQEPQDMNEVLEVDADMSNMEANARPVDDQDSNEIPEIDEENESPSFLEDLGAKARNTISSVSEFGADTLASVSEFGADLIEDDFASTRAHLSSKAEFIASTADSIGTQLSSGSGAASAPFVKLASAARQHFEFLDREGSDIRGGQVAPGVVLGLGLKGVGKASAALGSAAAAVGTAGTKVLNHGIKKVNLGTKKVLKGVGAAQVVAGTAINQLGAKKVQKGKKALKKAIILPP